MTINWHSVWQDLLDDHLPLLSGKEVDKGNREFSRQVRLDYYVEVKRNRSKDKSAPLYFLKKYNVMEFKGPNERLTVKQFRYYVGRALVVEGMEARTSRIGKVALTIMTSNLPRTVLASLEFKFKKISPWLYRSNWVHGLDIHIFVISKIRNTGTSDGMAYLQVLEGNPRLRRATWTLLMRQNLQNTAALNRIIIKIDKEVGMSLAEEFRNEGEIRGVAKGEIKGKIEGKVEGELTRGRRILSNFLALIPASLRDHYSEQLTNAQTIEELDRLEAEILQLSSQSA